MCLGLIWTYEHRRASATPPPLPSPSPAFLPRYCYTTPSPITESNPVLCIPAPGGTWDSPYSRLLENRIGPKAIWIVLIPKKKPRGLSQKIRTHGFRTRSTAPRYFFSAAIFTITSQSSFESTCRGIRITLLELLKSMSRMYCRSNHYTRSLPCKQSDIAYSGYTCAKQR